MTKAVNLIKYYYSKYSKLPSLKYISDHLNISAKTASEVVQRLRDQKVIVKNPQGEYYIPKPITYDEKAIKQPIKKDFSLLVIRVIMGIIGVGASVMSLYYTLIFLSEFLPTFWAFLLSAIMVLFSVVCIDVIIILKQNKKQGVLISVFSTAWLVVFLFSMASTMIGQYNARQKNIVVAVEESRAPETQAEAWEILQAQEKYLLEDIDTTEKSLNLHRENFNKMLETEKRDWYFFDARNRMQEAEKSLEKKRAELKATQTEKKDFLNSGKTFVAPENKNHDFYDWFGNEFGVSPGTVAFIVSIFPAMFIDIIAPLALAVSMFLRRKE